MQLKIKDEDGGCSGWLDGTRPFDPSIPPENDNDGCVKSIIGDEEKSVYSITLGRERRGDLYVRVGMTCATAYSAMSFSSIVTLAQHNRRLT